MVFVTSYQTLRANRTERKKKSLFVTELTSTLEGKCNLKKQTKTNHSIGLVTEQRTFQTAWT